MGNATSLGAPPAGHRLLLPSVDKRASGHGLMDMNA